MSKSKYVVGYGRSGYTEQIVALIFPDDITHSDLAISFFGDSRRILGAGFFYVADADPTDIKIVPYGDSVSLKVSSRPEDAHYLNKAVGFIHEVPGAIRRKDLEFARQRMRGETA